MSGSGLFYVFKVANIISNAAIKLFFSRISIPLSIYQGDA